MYNNVQNSSSSPIHHEHFRIALELIGFILEPSLMPQFPSAPPHSQAAGSILDTMYKVECKKPSIKLSSLMDTLFLNTR